MNFSFQVEGLDKIKRAGDRVKTEVAKELQKGLLFSAQKVEKEAKQSIMNGNKSGQVYRRRTVTHRASAPGEAPASDTGRLVNSISSYIKSASSTAIESFVVAGRGVVKYARMLEFGTAKMGARPFMFPAVEKSRAWIQERLARAVTDGIAKAAKK